MSDENIINWPSGYASSQRSSASSFPFELAAEIARLNHPTARPVRADLLSRVLPQARDVEVGRFPIPPSAVGVGVPSRLTRRRLSAGHCIAFVLGLLLGHFTAT